MKIKWENNSVKSIEFCCEEMSEAILNKRLELYLISNGIYRIVKFDLNNINDFKHCPFCGAEIIGVKHIKEY